MNKLNEFPLLNMLIAKGYPINILKGQLDIQESDNSKVFNSLSSLNKLNLFNELSLLLGLDIYIYDSYSTGLYGKNKAQGLTLQFINLKTGESVYTVFNVDLKTARKSKNHNVGDLLPKGQFRVSKNRLFYKFWLSTGLKLPPRLSSFHSYMGNLKNICFLAKHDDKGKIIDKLIPTLTVKNEQLIELLNADSADNSWTTDLQDTDSTHTTLTYKEVSKPHVAKGIQYNSSAYVNECGIRLYGDMVISNPLPTTNKAVRPQDQTNDEWLNAWDND